MNQVQNPDYIYIPAGSSQKIAGEFKHNLILNDKSILENTIDLGLNLDRKVITTVRDSLKIRENYKTNFNVDILEARENLIDSSIFALMEGYVNHYSNSKFTKNWANIRKIKLFLKENPHLMDLTMLCVGSDSPFLTSNDLKKFILNYNSLKEKPDIYVGLTNMTKLEIMNQNLNLKINNLESTINNYSITDNGIFRISNMYMFKPFKVLNVGIAGSLQKVYDNRKLSHGVTQYLGILSGFSSIAARVIMHPIASVKFARDAYVTSKHFQGQYTHNAIKLEQAFKNTSKVIGLDVKYDISCGLGPLLDIDDENSYYYFKENYDKITDYLLKH